MAQSRQIRISARAHMLLEKFAKRRQTSMADCASEIIDLFEHFVEEIERDNKIVIECPGGERKETVSGLLRKSRCD